MSERNYLDRAAAAKIKCASLTVEMPVEKGSPLLTERSKKENDWQTALAFHSNTYVHPIAFRRVAWCGNLYMLRLKNQRIDDLFTCLTFITPIPALRGVRVIPSLLLSSRHPCKVGSEAERK